MKILHMIETRGPGGAEIVMLNLANSYARRGHENYGLFIKSGWIEQQFSENHYKSYLYTRGARSGALLFARLLKVVATEQIRLVHAHEFYMCVWAALLSALLKVRSTCTLHGEAYHCETWRRRLLLKFISRFSALVVVSHDIKRVVCERAGIDSARITVVENGIVVPEGVGSGSLREELGLPERAIVIGSLGRLHSVKGHRYLVEAARIICAEYPEVHFFIAGEGEERGPLEQQILDSGLAGRAHLLGIRKDIPNLLASCDLFVLPSLSEGTSLALLEAMALGLPIIATRVGNNVNLLKDDAQSSLVAPADSQELLDALRSCLSQRSNLQRNQMNIDLVRSRYSVDAMSERYLEIYSGRVACS